LGTGDSRGPQRGADDLSYGQRASRAPVRRDKYRRPNWSRRPSRESRPLDGKLNAVMVRDFDRARVAARLADEAIARGESKPLLGVPMTVKELFHIPGLPTTQGIPASGKQAATNGSVAAARLTAAGAIVLGKTNVPFMGADWQSGNAVYGPRPTRSTQAGLCLYQARDLDEGADFAKGGVRRGRGRSREAGPAGRSRLFSPCRRRADQPGPCAWSPVSCAGPTVSGARVAAGRNRASLTRSGPECSACYLGRRCSRCQLRRLAG